MYNQMQYYNILNTGMRLIFIFISTISKNKKNLCFEKNKKNNKTHVIW